MRTPLSDGESLARALDANAECIEASIPRGNILGQSADFSLTYRPSQFKRPGCNPLALRITLHLDHYDFQTHGGIEVWRNDCWSTLHRLAGTEIEARKRVPYGRDVGWNDYLTDCRRLDQLARELMPEQLRGNK